MSLTKISGLLAIFGLLVMVPTGLLRARAQSSAGLSAQEILVRTATVYAQCKSYQDSGVVKIVYGSPGKEQSEERPFKTAFVRPDQFRFEYEENSAIGKKSRFIVWRQAQRVLTWWDLKPGVEEQPSLDLALAAATGVSLGSASTIPAMLLPGEVGKRRLTDMTEAKRIANAKLDKVDCLRLEGRFGGDLRTVWVEDNTFLIRRIEFQAIAMGVQTREITTYDPAINERVEPARLEFGAPVKKPA